MDTFEKRFRSLRGVLTQEEFAKRIGITKQKVSNYEKGIVKPNYEAFVLIAVNLNINLNWLVTGKGLIENKPAKEEYLTRKNIKKSIFNN